MDNFNRICDDFENALDKELNNINNEIFLDAKSKMSSEMLHLVPFIKSMVPGYGYTWEESSYFEYVKYCVITIVDSDGVDVDYEIALFATEGISGSYDFAETSVGEMVDYGFISDSINIFEVADAINIFMGKVWESTPENYRKYVLGEK